MWPPGNRPFVSRSSSYVAAAVVPRHLAGESRSVRALLLSAGRIALVSASVVAWPGAGGPLPTGWCAAVIGYFAGRPVALGAHGCRPSGPAHARRRLNRASKPGAAVSYTKARDTIPTRSPAIFASSWRGAAPARLRALVVREAPVSLPASAASAFAAPDGCGASLWACRPPGGCGPASPPATIAATRVGGAA